MKQQIIVISGGDCFNTQEEFLAYLKVAPLDFESYKSDRRSWKSNLQEILGEEYEVIIPTMPNKQNAKYEEWKIWFEKFIPYINNEVILIGHSLGGIFLTKYLSENNFPKTISGLFLVAAPFDDKDSEYKLADFVLAGNLSKVESRAKNIFIYHSQDDSVVPFTDLGKYSKALPAACCKIFTDRGHFIDESFPELVEDIKSLQRKS